jgi:hypothetical protein
LNVCEMALESREIKKSQSFILENFLNLEYINYQILEFWFFILNRILSFAYNVINDLIISILSKQNPFLSAKEILNDELNIYTYCFHYQ